ncbi:hypothetical protein HU200_019659 [Digitaria exilis]|uniref:Uncharacterized protein n=1 Tax=Digitaria exilis TaxID=1010633 RepID=A0A835F2M4_9POAL|nr:hypothetical protein HU200_019659 [Digitaria exilis]CAB3469885.1 unnamed protein product [Digitaria exilis]
MKFRLASRRRAAPGAQASGGGRRKRMAIARLGGGGGDGGGGGRKRRLFGVLRLRLRLRWPWLAAVYRRALRRLRASYEQALRELVDGTVLVGKLHAPAGVDCAHAASFGPMATVGF